MTIAYIMCIIYIR